MATLCFRPDCEGRQNIEDRLSRGTRTCFRKLAIRSDIEVAGVPQAFLCGFQNHEKLVQLEGRLKESIFLSLSRVEQIIYFEEQKQLALYRARVVSAIKKGKALRPMEKPKAPVSEKLENLLYRIELELTEKVINKMSTLNMRLLKMEFKLNEEESHKDSVIPGLRNRESAMITSFFSTLKDACEEAIESREKNYLHKAS